MVPPVCVADIVKTSRWLSVVAHCYGPLEAAAERLLVRAQTGQLGVSLTAISKFKKV